MKAIIIADDFTGANDTGLQLAKNGASIEVVMNIAISASSEADVLVINTESRAMKADNAHCRIAGLVMPVVTSISDPEVLLFKKIDSTLRGNLGAEIDAVMKLGNRQIAVFASAIPGAGRTVVDGQCLVHGVPLLDTEFARDPQTPVTSSDVKNLIEEQSIYPVQRVTLGQIRTDHLGQYFQSIIPTGERTIIVCDAVTDADLTYIANEALSLKVPLLFAGAAGLARALPSSMYCSQRGAPPVLVVAGSMSEATWQQIEYARSGQNIEIVDIMPDERLLSASKEHLLQLQAQCCAIIHSGKHCILRTCRAPEEREHIDELCTKLQRSRQQLGEALNKALGELVRSIADNTRIGALFLTGGDVATAVALALGASGYRIRGEVAPCIPWGTLINSDVDDLPVITKAGGFGTETTLWDALNFIEEMYCE